MFKIEYEIGLNEAGRPCIELPIDYEQNPEDRFFAIEIANYILQDVLSRRTPDLDKHTVTALDESTRLLGQLGDEISEILYESMKTQGELKMMLDGIYHIIVNSIEERDALPDKDIIYEGKIYDRIEGLKVAIQCYNEEDFTPHIEIYELVDGITNENWVKI